MATYLRHSCNIASGPLREILKDLNLKRDIGYSPILKRGMPAINTFLQSAGSLWCKNYPVDIRRANELGVIAPDTPDMLTDLPSYAFDHTHAYWHESRLSKAYRLREHPPHDFLGSRCLDWSPLDARWRLLIRVRELPWIADHIVDGRKIYPGTGMLVMAIQAAKELADPLRSVSGFVMRDIDFSSAMELEGPTETLEVITSLRPTQSVVRNTTSFDFNIISCTNPANDEWTRNIKGSIEIEYEEVEDWHGKQKMESAKTLTMQHQTSKEACLMPVDETFMYERLKWWGLDYGPSFQRAKEQFVSTNGEAVADIRTLVGDEEDLQPHVIHPVTMDAIGHLCFTAFSAGGQKSIATAMPSTIAYAWVSSSGLSAPQSNSIHTCSKVLRQTPRGFEANITGVNPQDENELLICIKGCMMAFISDVRKDSGNMQQIEFPNPAQQWFNVVRKVDLDMLSQKELGEYLREECHETAAPLDFALKYIELAAHENPGLRVLQLGAGDEAQSIVDAALDQEHAGVLDCAIYDIADDDQGRLSGAKNAFTSYGSKMHFYHGSSELQTKLYDLVFISRLRAQPEDLDTTLRNASSVLKPGGVLIAHGPQVERAIFASPVLSFQSENDHGDSIAIYFASEEKDSPPINHRIRVIVAGDFTCKRHADLVDELITHGTGLDIVPSSVTAAPNDPKLKESILILLSDPDHLCLSSMNPESLSALQTIMAGETKVLWISDKASEMSIGGSPVSTIMEGSARSLRMENNGLVLVLLTLESFERRSTRHIMNVLEKMSSLEKGMNYEQDYFEHAGNLQTDRLINSSRLKKAADARLTPQYKERVQLKALDGFELKITQFSQLDTLHFVESSPQEAVLPKHSIEIRVSAASIDWRDHREAMGKGNDLVPQFGSACAGEIVNTGNDCDFKNGDRVFAMQKDSLKSCVRTTESHAIRLPETIDFARACEKIPALAAMHYAITEVGRWRAGEVVLVYPCTGPMGTSAVQICQQLEATVFATVHSNEQSKELHERFSVPASNIYPHDSFYGRHIPGFRGADIVVCLEPPRSQKDWDVVARYGRVIYVPSGSDQSPSLPSLQPPANIGYNSLDFGQVVEERPQILEQSFLCAIDILSTPGKEGNPNTFPASKIVQAFKHILDANDNAVVILDAEDEILCTRNTKRVVYLDPDASYVISGGTGGIGRSMARWCAHNGARHLILLSRSGAKSEAAQDMVSSLRARGVYVEAPVCDTADEKILCAVINDCLLRMPPIKGCMQASGAYKDLTFDKYDLEGWNTAITSKAISSWNLHKTLPSGMDFFIMLSSVSSSIGPISMSSYAGANSYQDGLARHRISIGEKATALNPGVLHDIGFVTEFTDAQRALLQRVGFFIPTWEAEILAVLDIFCDPNCTMINDQQYRPIFGMNGAGQMAANGSEVPLTFSQPFWKHTHFTDVVIKDVSVGKSQGHDIRTSVLNEESLEGAIDVATRALRTKLAMLLSTQEERLQDGASVDSLVAIELRNWLGKTFGTDIPVFKIVSASTWSVLGEDIATHVREVDTST